MRKLGGNPVGGQTALLLSPEAPYPAIGGGPLRIAAMLEYLAGRYVVDLIVFQEPGAPDPRLAIPPGRVREIFVLPLDRHSKSFFARAARNLARLSRGSPPLNDRFAGFSGPIRAFLEGRRYDVAVIEHFWCAPYLEQLAPVAARTVLDLHNVESQLYASCAKIERFPLSLALRFFERRCIELERRWLPHFSLLLAASESDIQRVRALAPDSPKGVYPNSIPHLPLPNKPEENALIFTGNLEYGPNISAIRFFASEIWPLLRHRWPDLVWRIAGKQPDAIRRYVQSDPRIEVSGPVPNAIEAIAAAKLVVVPLLAGSGTRLKILEAWAAGRAVVSTPLGAEGLPVRDGEHLLLAKDPRDFAERVSALLASGERRKCLGVAGRALYEKEFTWKAAWARLDSLGV